MSVEKVSLTPLRSLLFFFFGAAGCLLPYLSLHIRETGLSIDESRLISIIAPLVAASGPIISGPLIDCISGKKKSKKSPDVKNDNNACIRTFLSITVLLSAIFYCLLLSVPTIQHLQPRQPEVSFVCNEYGASLVQEKCNELECYNFPELKTGLIKLKDCQFNCDFPSHYGYIENPMENFESEIKSTTTTSTETTEEVITVTTTTTSRRLLRPEVDVSNLDSFFGPDLQNEEDEEMELGSGEETDFDWDRKESSNKEKRDTGDFVIASSDPEPPHICYNNLTHKQDDKNLRMCFVYTNNSADFNVNVTLKPVYGDNKHCNYHLGGNFSCRIPRDMEKPNESCKVICVLEDAYVSGSVLLQSQCQHIIGDPKFTFWLYLALRSLGDLFTSISVSILISATLVAARQEIGREFILPSIAYGLFAVIIGYLHSDGLSPLKLENIPNFFLGIVGFGLLSMFALFVLIFSADIPIGPPEWWWTTRNVQIRHKGEFCAVLFILFLMGILWGPYYSHVPWHIVERKGLELYVGCSVAVGALLSIPVVWKADTIIDYCGYSNVLICAFTFYILRYTGLFFVQNPWVLLITGGMEVFTMCLMIFSAILYIRHLVPKHLTFTSQSLAVAAHFCLGNGLGCFISTLLSPSATELEAALRNSTRPTEEAPIDENEEVQAEDEFESLYYRLYCVGAVASAAVALVYFFVYHFCLKKRCLAPPYRKEPTNSSLVSGPANNGIYTPLRVYHNGREQTAETGS